MKFIAVFAAIFFTMLSVALADDVTDSLDKVRKFYERGNYSQAVSELQFTMGLIQDRQLDKYKTILPDPPEGWTGQKIQVSRNTALGFSGGISVSRVYNSKNGQKVTVEAVMDSPLVSGLIMLLSNPMLMGNNRLVMVKGQKAMEEWDQESGKGKLQIIIQNRMLVTISGEHLDSRDTLRSFAEKIDFGKIKKMLQES